MAETPTTLEAGTYEVLRARLDEQARLLRERVGQLNAARQEVFGTIETALVATERVATENNCEPRDMVAFGPSRFLFGYNVHFGLRVETRLEDVFAAYEWRDRTFHALPLDFLRDETFLADFRSLFKYYRQTVFARFAVIGPHLFFVFRIGANPTDIKTFKWVVDDAGRFTYLGNRSDHEVVAPPQHEFEWRRTHRDLHRDGLHPHVSIDDRLFVECVGGDLTIKVEDNTASGAGIYSEPVEHVDQTLDDAEIFFAVVGPIILLRIRPYQERAWRYFIYNAKLQQVHRVDALERACVLLPDGQGLIFARGYYLVTGELKIFETVAADLEFDRRIVAPNREDHLFCFQNSERGEYVLLPYNVIAQRVEAPIPCHGFSIFENGELALFRAEIEPRKTHAIQIWQTPFTAPAFQTAARTDSHLYKVGNGEIVRCMAECQEILALLGRAEPYASLYVDLQKKTTDLLDVHFWLRHESAGGLAEPLEGIREAAARTVEEFDKVLELRRAAAQRLDETGGRARALLDGLKAGELTTLDAYVRALADLRAIRGELITLREVRYIDLPAVDALEAEVADRIATLSQSCVEFLSGDEALAPLRERVEAFDGRIGGIARVVDGRALEEEMNAAGADLGLLIEIVENLPIADATATTRILDAIAAVYARLNQFLARLRQQLSELRGREGAAQFGAQMKLIAQSVANLLDRCDTPERCDEGLGRMMVQLEELETRFAESDEFLAPLAEKRGEIVAAFEARKLQLVESRNRRSAALLGVADRMLKGIQTRAAAITEVAAIHGFFASDFMVGKLRDVIQELLDLGDPVKADDVQARLKTLREEAVRQLKDRQELFVDGADVVAFGPHRFNVHTQPVELTLQPRGDDLALHLSGTRFFEPVRDADLEALRPVWEQELISESPEVSRAEWLAFQMLGGIDLDAAAEWTDAQGLDAVRTFMAPRYAEGYVRGVHDADAATLLAALAPMRRAAGPLRHHPEARALGLLAWEHGGNPVLAAQLASYGAARHAFAAGTPPGSYLDQLIGLCTAAIADGLPFPQGRAPEAAAYLFDVLTGSPPAFTFTRDAAALVQRFEADLKAAHAQSRFAELRKSLAAHPWRLFEALRDWLDAHLARSGGDGAAYRDEAALLLLRDTPHAERILDVELRRDVSGLLGPHPRVRDGAMTVDYLDFTARLERHAREVAPAFTRFHERKRDLVEAAGKRLRVPDLRPRVLTSFVRNRLVDEVFLPLIGANLAKQIGTAGANTRTDRMGLLLLISPPGYGKTTLMEYLASRLGLVLMKINGPALGHQVTALDPAQAPNAAAREELERLNLAFEIGDNVMIYLDDIQHCAPEFLQKFISLCDGQRRIEGVYRGEARTYDFRGRKVAVVMAGNPYTESGEKFRIPDMLANRADTYNLGDIALGQHHEAFKLSYLENALTSNAVLNPLASRSRKDVHGILRLAVEGGAPDLEGSYSARELDDMVAVAKKLIRIRDVILTVNAEYIRSAAQAEAYRTEPPFQLQGSYRNMNRLAEKVVPVMNDVELEALIADHYRNEAQTLATGAEANLLKLRELLGTLTPDEAKRWEEIRKTFRRNLLVKGGDEADPATQVVRQLIAVQAGLEGIRDALAGKPTPGSPSTDGPAPADVDLTKVAISRETLQRIWQLIEADHAVRPDGADGTLRLSVPAPEE